MITNTKKLPNYIKLNHKIRPQDDFYSYVCHKWCLKHPLPKTKSRWGVFDKVKHQVDQQIKVIIQDWVNNPKDLNASQKKVIQLYDSLINNHKHTQNSLKVLDEIINQIKETTQTESAKFNLISLAEKLNLSLLFDTGVSLDSKNNDRYCLNISPVTLNLGNRDYYLSPDSKFAKIRLAYLDFLTEFQHKLEAKYNIRYNLEAQNILDIETSLAKIMLPVDQARDLEKIYNPYALDDLENNFNFNWSNHFKILNLKNVDYVIVSEPNYLKQVLNYIDELTVDQLKDFLIFNLNIRYAKYLDDDLPKTMFNFFGKILQGTEKLESKTKRTINMVNHSLTDIIGKTYIKKHFNEAAKKETALITKEIAKAFDKRLKNNPWMSEISKNYACFKLKKIIVNLGYSGIWFNYDSLELKKNNPIYNLHQISLLIAKNNFKLLTKSPNRKRFGDIEEGVQDVNAWTNIVLLNTNYPAGILQPPFYDYKASFMYNLGALGSVIGHELSHNFDNQGSKYDVEGHLNPWLSSKEKHFFKLQANKLIKLANKHYVTPKIHVQGKQVVGEIIADLGGLEIALEVVKSNIKDKKQQQQALRQVFISYAFHWAVNQSTEARVMQAKSGVHPDAVYRVNGIVSHCDDFYSVFDVKKGDNLYLKPQDRISIW